MIGCILIKNSRTKMEKLYYCELPTLESKLNIFSIVVGNVDKLDFGVVGRVFASLWCSVRRRARLLNILFGAVSVSVRRPAR